jgi:hypothetical protein
LAISKSSLRLKPAQRRRRLCSRNGASISTALMQVHQFQRPRHAPRL